ncbi:MAG: hypothetical protein H7Y02_08970 [Candidatus Obscuribacterales bacterium]|nr:hypothetical protein [Steroidobacteraceae bacterium]
MPKSNSRARKIVAGFAVLFIGLVIAIIVLLAKKIITIQMAGLMFVAVVGIYVGFGVLIAVYRFVGKLQ